MLPVRTVNQFREDLTKAKKQGKDTELLKQVITNLARSKPLAEGEVKRGTASGVKTE